MSTSLSIGVHIHEQFPSQKRRDQHATATSSEAILPAMRPQAEEQPKKPKSEAPPVELVTG